MVSGSEVSGGPDWIRGLASQLSDTISDVETLIPLLCAPLNCLGLLPPRFRKNNTDTSATSSATVLRYIPAIQRALLLDVVPTWIEALAERKAEVLVEQCFCPDAFSAAKPAASQLVLCSYSTLLSTPMTSYSLRILARLTREYPTDRLNDAIFDQAGVKPAKQMLDWEDCVRNLCAVPAKVANYTGRLPSSSKLPEDALPSVLSHAAYFDALSRRCEELVWKLSEQIECPDRVDSIVYLLTKLVNVGVFPTGLTPPASDPSFFRVCLPAMRARISEGLVAGRAYWVLWGLILASIPSPRTTQTILSSLFASISPLPSAAPTLDDSKTTRSHVKWQATLPAQLFITKLHSAKDSEHIWNLACDTMLSPSGEWREGHARLFVCIAVLQGGEIALGLLLGKVVEMWTTPEFIKHSLLHRHHYITALLLLTLYALPPHSSEVQSLSTSSSLIHAIGTYIGHIDHSVRRCGMLVAEMLATAVGKKLDFGKEIWENDNWSRQLRALLTAKDSDADLASLEIPVVAEDADKDSAEIPTTAETPCDVSPSHSADSDDESIQGYADSERGSSRSPSPSLSELNEIREEPALAAGKKKIPKPVYLLQLGELVRGTTGLKQPDPQEEAEKLQVALNVGEELVRKKAAYGTELKENAVNLVYAFVGLQDNFELDGFSPKRQAIVTSLVACCPQLAAPTVIQEFFKNQYSTDQRFVMLNALAIGARELAGMPVPETLQSGAKERISFPSKHLPPHLHQKYLTMDGGPVQRMVQSLSRDALASAKEPDTAGAPSEPLIRERRLRLQQPPKIELLKGVAPQPSVRKPAPAPQPPPRNNLFIEVAAEYFTCPLINRFWSFLRDERTREERTAYLAARNNYRGAGTGLILHALVLSQFLGTVAVLAHASRNAPEWLAVVAPEALELAVTLGTRPMSLAELVDGDLRSTTDQEPGDDVVVDGERKEAAVLSTALELALVVLDGCIELDGGRSLGLEHTVLLMAAGEWAGKLFGRLEKGERIKGGGGEEEARLGRAAAGVVLKVDEVRSRWGRSMIDVV